MKNKIGLLSVLLISLFGLMINVNAEEKFFIVGDTKLTKSNNVITDGNDGRAIWNEDENTLMIENFDYEGDGVFIDEWFSEIESFYTLFGTSSNDLTKIILRGNNTFTLTNKSNGPSIAQIMGYFKGETSFEGNGKLTFNIADDNESAGTLGLASLGNLSFDKVSFSFNSKASLDYLIGMLTNSLSIRYANIEIDLANIGSAGAIVSNEVIELESSYLNVKADNCYDFGIIEGNMFSANSSIVKIVTTNHIEDTIGIRADNGITFTDSKVSISTGKEGLLTDYFMASGTDAEIAAENNVLRSGGIVDVSTYDENLVWVNPSFAGFFGVTTWDQATHFSNYKYLRLGLYPNNGEYQYNLDNEKLKILNDDVTSYIKLTDVDLYKISRNLNIKINLLLDDNIDIYDKDIVNNNLGNYNLGKLLNISLTKRFGNSLDSEVISETKNKIKFSYKLDDELIKDNRTYKLLRVHNGLPEFIDCLFDKDAGELIFESDKFSTYAILYTDEEVKEEIKEEIKNPVTGDNIVLLSFASLLSLAGIGTTLYLFKKKYRA